MDLIGQEAASWGPQQSPVSEERDRRAAGPMQERDNVFQEREGGRMQSSKDRERESEREGERERENHTVMDTHTHTYMRRART